MTFVMNAKKAELPVLTRAESEVLQALWTLGEGTVQQLLEQMGKQVAYTTVLTLVRILEQKGYVDHIANPAGGRAHLFRPKVDSAKARRRHVRDLVDRLFGGQAESLVARLIEDESLSREDLETLREKIDERLENAPRRKR
ncbi:MAG TPA: MarR family transcriptional regulator [Myxococcales bacterium]|nr:MarR family transcriptional regulator [Myxococcales bacterium]